MENLQQSTLDDHQSAEIIAGEEEQQSTPDDDQTTISVANEDIISEILSRLPVKSILRFRSVCKPWLSLISDPSFTKLQTTAGRRTALLISAYDTSTRRRYFLSAAPHGGPVTHIVTPYGKTITNKETTEIEHLNGLILFTSGNGFIEHNFAFVINPSTRKMLKLGGPASNPDRLSYGKGYICYFFGFDELRNEYKILTIRMLNVVRLKPFEPRKIEIMIFSMSDLSWRKIDVDLPDEVVEEWNIGTKHGVCVNGVIHLILQNRDEILAFDLRTEKFSVIDLPADAVRARNSYCWKGLNTIISDQPFLTTINGFLGVMCRNPTVDGMDVWTLRDYENRCWVRETVGFEKSWFVLDGPFPLNSFIRKDNNGRRLSMDMINVDVYDVESDSMKSVEFTFGYEFLHPKTVRFDHVRSYTESILPLHMN